MTSEIIARIQKARHAISRPQLLDGTYTNFVQGGLEWITLCEWGTKRSPDSAKRATNNYNVPSLYLIGGLMGLLEYFNHQKELEKFILQINNGPSVAVILKPEQFAYYEARLPTLKYEKFYSEDHFIDHIS